MWRTEVRVKTKRKTLRGMREKEAIVYSSPNLLSGNYSTFSSPTGFLCGFFGVHGAGGGRLVALLFTVFQKSSNCLILLYHHLSANMRSLFHYGGGFIGTKGQLCPFSLFPSLSLRWSRHISQSNFQNNSLMFFPVQGMQDCICLALT